MRQMKDSGVEWIGEIPEKWEVIPMNRIYIEHKCKNRGNKVKNVLSLSYGRIIPRDVSGNMGLLPESFETYNIVEPDNIVLRLTDLQNDQKSLRTGLVKEHGIITSAYMTLKMNCPSDSKYNHYLLHTYDVMKIIYNMGNGVRQNLKYAELSKLPLVVPPFVEQHHIADFLDRKCAQIDTIIAKQQAVIEKLKLYKQSVITEAVTKGLDPDVPMKDSGIEWIGVIPAHWLAPKIKYMASITSGGTPDRNRPEYWNGNINWLKTGELKNAEIYGSEEKITEEGLANSSAKIFSENTILMAMYGQGKTRGTTALLKVPCSTNQACAGIRLVNKAFSTGYLWKCLIGAYDSIRGKAEGSGQPNLSGDLISDFYLPMPPIKEQKDICTYIDCKCSHIDILVLKKQILINKLTQYKKSLIYEAVTGKLEV